MPDIEAERDDLAQALSESWDRSAAANPASEPAVEAAPVEAPAGKITGADPLQAGDTEPPEAAEPKPDADGRVRAPDGKFAAAKPAEGVKAPAQPIGQQAAPPPDQPWAKAPQSLKPEAREEWAKLVSAAPALAQEFHRRERDHAVALQRSTEQARQVEPLLRAVQPFAQQLAARGQAVPDVISNFLRTEQALSHPDERTRAQVLAGAMGTYRISVAALADAIEGGAGTQAAHVQQSPALTPDGVVGLIRQVLQGEQRQSAVQRAHSEIEAFKGEFLGDLKPAMAAMIQAGVATDLQGAYDAACWADPRIRGIIQQREASKSAANATASTQRARAASASVKSSPGGASNGAPPGDSWADHLEASWDKSAGR